jgi:hypothetical protein
MASHDVTGLGPRSCPPSAVFTLPYGTRSVCHASGLWYAREMMSCAMQTCSAAADVKYYLWPARDGRLCSSQGPRDDLRKLHDGETTDRRNDVPS